MIELNLDYEKIDEKINKEKFLEEEGSELFDNQSKNQMLVMIEIIINELGISDEYSIKKLECMLRYELPFFATNRRLVKNWVVNNFMY
ncbi:hypothetical protein ACKGJI_05790 [Sulfurospirillum sp. 1307]